jgi:hypothetical protein
LEGFFPISIPLERVLSRLWLDVLNNAFPLEEQSYDLPIQPIARLEKGLVTISKLNWDLNMPLKS